MSKWGSMYPYDCSKAALNMDIMNVNMDIKEDKMLLSFLHKLEQQKNENCKRTHVIIQIHYPQESSRKVTLYHSTC